MTMKPTSILYLIGAIFLITILFCEFLIYYVVLAKCQWPEVGVTRATESGAGRPVRAMLLADTHLLGPFRGHWWDKLRREWQMHRGFQSAIQLFYPKNVFFLGDLFDEGEWVDQRGFIEYVHRFKRLFHTPEDIKVFGVVGNHDVGFHYRLHPVILDRFNEAFNKSAINLHTINDVHFITINSMAMENDGCNFCVSALKELKDIQYTLDCSRDPDPECIRQKTIKGLKYSKPILLQHFPTYRKSDENCLDGDIPKLETYRENWEVLSRKATEILGNSFNPRVIFSGHSHHYCKIKNTLNIEEYTVSSFSWRNKNNPSFLLAMFTPDKYAVSICYLPQETTVIKIYGFSLFLNSIIFAYYFSRWRKNKKD